MVPGAVLCGGPHHLRREKELADMKKTHYSCGLDVVLELIEGKWKFLILWHLASGPKRFGELRRLVGGVSEKMLIQELKEMVADNITIRQDFKEVPPKVVYSLTEGGMVLAEACKPLCTLGAEIANREKLTIGSFELSMER
jgi:DNA-binding HxlR family transcriptional regulator